MVEYMTFDLISILDTAEFQDKVANPGLKVP